MINAFRNVLLRADANSRAIEGFIPLFDYHEVWENYFERFERSAFEKADMSKIDLTLNHREVLCTEKSGLTVEITDKGIVFKGNINETQAGNDALVMMRNGDIRGCSFAMGVADSKFEEDKGIQRITYTQIDRVSDVSVVNRPAYADTTFIARKQEVMNNIARPGEANTARARNLTRARKWQAFLTINQTNTNPFQL